MPFRSISAAACPTRKPKPREYTPILSPIREPISTQGPGSKAAADAGCAGWHACVLSCLLGNPAFGPGKSVR